MVLDAEKRRHLTVVAMQKKIAHVPFALVPSAPGPLVKDKRLKGVAEVAEVAPSEDEDTYSGLVCKRKRKADAAISVPSDSDGQAPSYKECPPSAFSPRDIMVQEGRGECLGGQPVGPLYRSVFLSPESVAIHPSQREAGELGGGPLVGARVKAPWGNPCWVQPSPL